MVQHLALVMDGNRRWAKKQGFKPWLGHQQGAESVQRVIKFCLTKKIPYLSLYTFSLENFRRPTEELIFLFDLLIHETNKHLQELISQSIKICFIGDRSQFPEHLRETITCIEVQTANGIALQLNLLFCYGARQEIVGAVKAVFNDIQQQKISADDISDELLQKYLWTSSIPEPELIIRTGGVKRLSNFLLYQAAYSELYFLDCLWPELNQGHLEEALNYYTQVQRNFGT